MIVFKSNQGIRIGHTKPFWVFNLFCDHRILTHSSSYDIRYCQSLCCGVVSHTRLQAPDKSAVKVVAAEPQGSNWKWMGKLCVFAALLGLVWTQPVAGSRYKVIWPIICQIPPPNQSQQRLDYLMGLKIILPGFPAVWGMFGSDFTLPYLLGRLIIILHKLFYLWPPPQHHKQSVILCETLLLCGGTPRKAEHALWIVM